MTRNFPFDDSQVRKLREMYLEVESFRTQIREIEREYQEKVSERCTGVRKKNGPDIFDLPRLLAKKFSEDDLSLLKNFGAYLVKTYPPEIKPFNLDVYRERILFPDEQRRREYPYDENMYSCLKRENC